MDNDLAKDNAQRPRTQLIPPRVMVSASAAPALPTEQSKAELLDNGSSSDEKPKPVPPPLGVQMAVQKQQAQEEASMLWAAVHDSSRPCSIVYMVV